MVAVGGHPNPIHVAAVPVSWCQSVPVFSSVLVSYRRGAHLKKQAWDDSFDDNFITALLWQVFPSVLYPFVCTDQVCVSFNQETELIKVHALIVKTWIFLEVSLCF